MRFYKILPAIAIVLTISLSCHRKQDAEQQEKNTVIQNNKPPNSNNSSYQTGPKYGIKSAIITFETDIAGNKGKKMLYIDEYGKLEKEIFYDGDTPRDGFVTSGGVLYRLNYKLKMAYKLGQAKYGNAFKFDWNDVPEAEKKAGHAIKTENMNIAGKNCESYKIDNAGIVTTFAGWNGMCLFAMQHSNSGDVITKAVKIQDNIAVPAETFSIPSGFKIK